MRKYKIYITLINGEEDVMESTEDAIKKFGNVNDLVFAYTRYPIRRIIVKSPEKDRSDLTYEYTYERWLQNGIRIEAENDPGFEDYSGYGARTDGKFNRFYLGRSTGWIPIYLEVLQRNSHGGGALMHENRKLKPLYHLSARR